MEVHRPGSLILVALAALSWACGPDQSPQPLLEPSEGSSIPDHILEAVEASGINDGPVAVLEMADGGRGAHAVVGSPGRFSAQQQEFALAAASDLPLAFELHPNGGTRDSLDSKEILGRSASGTAGWRFICIAGSPPQVYPVYSATVTNLEQKNFPEPSGGHVKPPSAEGAEHDYSDTATGRPVGTWSDTSGVTEPDGRFYSTITANIASGDEKVVLDWYANDSPCVGISKTDEFRAAIRVPGLVEIAAGADLVLSPPDSHDPAGFWYLTPETLTSVQRLGREHRKLRGSALVLTAASLIQGGINDIDRDWAPWHVEHRIGTDVDIDDYPNDNLPEVLLTLSLLGESPEIGFAECDVHFRNHVHCREYRYE